MGRYKPSLQDCEDFFEQFHEAAKKEESLEQKLEGLIFVQGFCGGVFARTNIKSWEGKAQSIQREVKEVREEIEKEQHEEEMELDPDDPQVRMYEALEGIRINSEILFEGLMPKAFEVFVLHHLESWEDNLDDCVQVQEGYHKRRE